VQVGSLSPTYEGNADALLLLDDERPALKLPSSPSYSFRCALLVASLLRVLLQKSRLCQCLTPSQCTGPFTYHLHRT
jgi:hypothetical protein